MQHALKHDLGSAGMVLLALLFAQNLFQLPVLMLRRWMFLLGGHGFTPFIGQLVETLIYCGTMLLTIFFGIWIFRCGRDFLFPLSTPRSDYTVPALGAGLGVGMLGSILATLLTILLATGGIQVAENAPSFNGGIATTLLTLFSVSVLPAVLEELLFRGVLLQPLRRYGDRLAILLSALMFALCHPTLPQAANAFLMGLCLGVFAVRSGSLVVPMLIHLLYNASACIVTLFSDFLPFTVGAVLSWLIIFCLLGVGIYGTRLLRRRFGPVWWVPPAPYGKVPGGQLAYTLFCSLPFMLALLMNAAVIFRNLYIY